MPKKVAKTKSVSTAKSKVAAKAITKTSAKGAAAAKGGGTSVLETLTLDVVASQVGLPMGRLVDEVRRALVKRKDPAAPRDDVRRVIERLVTERKLEVVGRGLFPMTTDEADEDEAFRPTPKR